jgi:hypothetical protein
MIGLCTLVLDVGNVIAMLQLIALGGRSVKLLRSGNSPTAGFKNDRRESVGAPRVMYHRPLLRSQWAWSPRRINALARGLSAKRYLEIGIEYGNTAENIRVSERVGVDPNPRFDVTKLPKGFSLFAVESDAYFASLTPESIFDIAFLDGLHNFEQTKADLFNALAHVPSGVILIDDTVPFDEIAAIRDQQESLARRRAVGLDDTRWMGDVWRIVVYINRYLPQLDFRTIVGSGNDQTLVWRRQPGEMISEPSGDEETKIAGLRYDEVLGDGIPLDFKPCSEDEAIRACLAAVTRNRSS